MYALEQLPDDVRDVVVLRTIRGLAGTEVAGLLGVSTASVSMRLHRGLELMRKCLCRAGSGDD
jgi:DNA-directed RNA polymerase specialized sigma24 family protein